MFERPIFLWLLAAAPLVMMPGWLAMGAGRRLAGAGATGLRLLCFVAAIMVLAGLSVPFRASADRMTLVVALDESRSIAPDQHAWMLRQVNALRRAMDPRDRLALVGFGRDARMLAPAADPRLVTPAPVTVDAGATDIAGALTTASGFFSGDREKRLLLLSDGNETQGDARSEVAALADDGVPVYTAAPPPSARARVAITDFAAPTEVRADGSFALRFDVESEALQPTPAELKLLADGAAVGGRKITLAPGLNRFQLPYRIARPGGYLITAQIAVAAPLVAVNPSADTALSVSAPPRVLMIADSPPESLIHVLKLRGYQIAMAAPRGLPLRPQDYLGYQAVIIANTPAEALDQGAQQALNHYVADFGGGLIVLGDSLRDSAFHDGPLEQVLPITFVPQPPPPSREPIAVYLLIDRSNSMSYNSRFPAVRDGERINYAKQAAAALLKQLDDTDYAGVIAFDSDPHPLGPLRPLGQDRRELLEEVARLEPGGGTDFKEALEIAKREILQSGVAVREVILLTDGDTNRQYHDHDQLMADFARQGVPVSTVRIGPDLENLRLLQDFAQVTGGVFYRVEDITKLPQLLVHLTHEAQNFKLHEHARVDLGGPSSILSGLRSQPVPFADFFAITQAKDGAAVPLIARKGQVSAPLLAAWQYELGRSAIFAADPDSLGSLAWLRWDRYAEFWSQLVSWVARAADTGPFTLRARNSADGTLQVEAEKADQTPVGNLFCRISGPHQTADIALTQIAPSLYRGESAPLTRGKYSLALMIKPSDTEQLLSRREIAATGLANADADELKLRPSDTGLLRDLAEGTQGKYNASLREILTHGGGTIRTWRSLDSILVPLAILTLLGEILIRHRYLGD
jgi:Ca-activated chloride channel homolog